MNQQLDVITPSSLPKGGGTIQGMGEALGKVGMTGQAGLTLPLPVSAGRGHAPSAVLAYGSGSGNGPFGLGWSLAGPWEIRRRTSLGVPRYQDDDLFLGPDGEVLVIAAGDDNPVTVSTYGDLTLDQSYTVTRYLPRIESGFDRIERWQGKDDGNDFWLVHGSDGQLHCAGKSVAARVADPADASRIARWLLEESVTPSGEHISYQYRHENADGVTLSGAEALRDHAAQCYPLQFQYGNTVPCVPLYAWGQGDPPVWLFTLVFDYGERGTDGMTAPPWTAPDSWPVRQDPFSDYACGFELRTLRLCRQVLMFHQFAALGTAPVLVGRLLFDHDETPLCSQLVGARHWAYDSRGTPLSLPPLDLGYAPFSTDWPADGYQPFPALPGLDESPHYQLVDLYGEGLPGVLYRNGSDWRYRPPQRDAQSGGDAIAYGPWESLPLVPTLQADSMALMDLNGDGRLDWLLASPGLSGYFTLNPDHSWSGFVPFPALPTEFHHPEAQLADLIGAGLSDLALIGPRSVRLYANRREAGFGPGEQVDCPDATLPTIGHDPAALVAFSDILGSGQQHLVRIRHDRIECWPNLGRGHFGAMLTLADDLPFDAASFNPARVFLADLDGSGAADMIYAESDQIRIFLNQSGNGFDSNGHTLPLPAGIRFDDLCHLAFADVGGNGTASLVLSVPHMTPQHWRYDFAAAKPYLLTSMNNNMGAGTTWSYRGSAQEWLDEKQAAPEHVCSLPFAMPLLSRMVSTDEITGNTLTQQYHYRQGVYDGACREFRGFGFVQHLDTDACAVPTGSDDDYSPPTLTRAWYHTGVQDAEDNPADTPYADPALFALGPSRFSSLNTGTGADDVLPAPDASTLFQLSRALKGSLLRQEVYGQDGSAQAGVPYHVQTARYQVRLLQPASDTQPYAVVLPMLLEQLDVHYERIASDPLVQQQVTLQVDAYGVPTTAVAINYARRPQGEVDPYPSTLPATLWDSSYDDAQQSLRLTESLTGVYHLTDPQAWRLGLPWQQRRNVVTDPDGYAGYPVGNSSTGLDYEALVQPDGVLGDSQPRDYAGQSLVCYFNQAGTAQQDAQSAPPWLALVHHIEVAELDAEALHAYDDVPDFDLKTELAAAGYAEQPLLFPRADESAATVWVIAHGYHGYVDAEGAWLPFNLPRTQQSSLLVGASTLAYDDDSCVVVSSTDALGNQTRTACDYRFLAPWQLIDANGNKQEVLFDALGRVCATSFYGSELDENDAVISTGFNPVADYDAGAAALASIDAALDDPAGAVQGCASACLYQSDSWMGSISQAGLAAYGSAAQAAAWWQALLHAHLIAPDGRIRSRGHAWARGATDIAGLPSSLRPLLTDAPRSPVQSAILQADQYPGAGTAAQIRIALTQSDGFGRALQSKQKAEPGDAYQVDADGNVLLNDNGMPVVADTGTAPRWTVSGRVEYDNKGQPIRQYQPYFINAPQYVNDSSIRNWGYADTHYHDALGREIRVVTALGYLRRHSDYPWFSVDEDENDTLSEVLSAQGAR